MKLIAKANLSGPFGNVEAGGEFVVNAAAGAELVQRGIAEEVPTTIAKSKDLDKAPAEAS